MKNINRTIFRKLLQITIIIALIILSTGIQSTLAETAIKDTIIWEHHFTDMSNPYGMAVKALEVCKETKKVFASVVYTNGTAVYCLNSETGEIIWRVDASFIYNETNNLIYVKSITIPSEDSLKAVYIGGVGINIDNIPPHKIPSWFSEYPGPVFGYIIKLDINTGEMLWVNTNCSTYTPKIVTGHFTDIDKVDIAALIPEGIIAIDGETGTTLWEYTPSRSIAPTLSYLFTVESEIQDYSDLIICFSQTNPRVIKVSGKNGTLLWAYDDSSLPNSYYGTKDAFVCDITSDGIVDLVSCNSNRVMAINGATGSLLWNLGSKISDIAIGDLYSNGSKIIVGKFVEELTFINGMTGKGIKQTVVEEGYISSYVFIEDLNNDGKLEVLVSSFGSVIAILDASGQKHHYIKGEGVLSEILIADVAGSNDLEVIAGTVTIGWIGVLGHGLSSGIDLFFPLLVVGGSLGILGLLGGYFWWVKRKKM